MPPGNRQQVIARDRPTPLRRRQVPSCPPPPGRACGLAIEHGNSCVGSEHTETLGLLLRRCNRRRNLLFAFQVALARCPSTTDARTRCALSWVVVVAQRVVRRMASPVHLALTALVRSCRRAVTTALGSSRWIPRRRSARCWDPTDPSAVDQPQRSSTIRRSRRWNRGRASNEHPSASSGPHRSDLRRSDRPRSAHRRDARVHGFADRPLPPSNTDRQPIGVPGAHSSGRTTAPPHQGHRLRRIRTGGVVRGVVHRRRPRPPLAAPTAGLPAAECVRQSATAPARRLSQLPGGVRRRWPYQWRPGRPAAPSDPCPVRARLRGCL